MAQIVAKTTIETMYVKRQTLLKDDNQNLHVLSHRKIHTGDR